MKKKNEYQGCVQSLTELICDNIFKQQQRYVVQISYSFVKNVQMFIFLYGLVANPYIKKI